MNNKECDNNWSTRELVEVNNTSKKEIPGLYGLKAFCALFVVILHVPFVAKDTLTPFIRIAVPCFFMISGYFLYCEDTKNVFEKGVRWAKTNFFLACWLNLFYFILKSTILHGTNIYLFLLSFARGDTIILPLWYLTALWQGLIIIIIILKAFPFALKYAPFLIFINLLAGRYSFMFDLRGCPLPSYVTLNCVAVALPCLSIGYLLRSHHNYLVHMLTASSLLALLFLFSICMYVEEYILVDILNSQTSGYSLFTLPVAIMFFILFLRLKNLPTWLVAIGKKHSANVYFFHIFIAEVVTILLGPRLLNIDMVNGHALIVFLVTIVFSCVLKFVYRKLRSLINR